MPAILFLKGLIGSKGGRYALLFLAFVIWTMGVWTEAYLRGKNNQAAREESRRKDAVIAGLQADLKLQTQISANAAAAHDAAFEKRKEQEDQLSKYAKRLAQREKSNDASGKIFPSQCPRVCGIDDDFRDTLRGSGRRVQ